MVRDIPVTICDECFAVNHANQHKCYHCGYPTRRGLAHMEKQEKKGKK